MQTYVAFPSDACDGTYIVEKWNELIRQYERIGNVVFPNMEEAELRARFLNMEEAEQDNL
jgi:hypothetical protein